MSKSAKLKWNDGLEHEGTAYSIRPLLQEDLTAILQIERRSHKHPWSESNFQSSLKSHHCVGLFEQGETLLAYAVFTVVVKEAELLLFVVDRCFWGRGLAAAFLRNLIDSLSDHCSSVFLELRKANNSAHYLYSAVGFNEIGVRPNYYPGTGGEKEDATLMALDFAFGFN